MMKEYRTSNLYEASYLSHRGFQFSGKEKFGTKVTLIFPYSQELNQTIIEFYKSDAKKLFDWYRTLKDYVFSD